jgi:alpha-amylase
MSFRKGWILVFIAPLVGAFCVSCETAGGSLAVSSFSSSSSSSSSESSLTSSTEESSSEDSSSSSTSSSSSSSCSSWSYDIGTSDNAEGSVGYEIFVGSFADSDGDGIGDLNGIVERLGYLQTLGVHRLWLTPIFPSPTYHKYDATDYYSIDSSFGTLADFDTLVTTAHSMGFSIILDLVINHSSNKNPWFIQSEEDYAAGNTEAGSKKDWYSWSSSIPSGTQSSYTYDSIAKAYYEANFSSSMPEFNLASAEVVAEFEAISSFWLLGHGIDGFRLDATLYYFYLQSDENVAFLSSYRDYILSIKPDAYLVGEEWNSAQDQATLNKYATSGLSFFNFPTAQTNGFGPGDVVNSPSKLKYYAATISAAQKSIDESADGSNELCLFLTNHDMDRWGNYFGTKANPAKSREVCASLYLLSPGTPWMYYGEEIMMTGTRGALSTDAPRRQGMVWGGGVTACDNPENYVSTNQVTLGALDALEIGDSTTNHYRKIIAVRNRHNALFEKGVYSDLGLVSTAVCGFTITYDDESYVLVHNISAGEVTLSLSSAVSIVEDINTSGTASTLVGTNLIVEPYSSVLVSQ